MLQKKHQHLEEVACLSLRKCYSEKMKNLTKPLKLYQSVHVGEIHSGNAPVLGCGG